MADIISLAAHRDARRLHDGQDGRRPERDAPARATDERDGSGATPCSVLLFTGIRYEHGDAPPGWVGRPWFGRLEPRDTAEPGTS